MSQLPSDPPPLDAVPSPFTTPFYLSATPVTSPTRLERERAIERARERERGVGTLDCLSKEEVLGGESEEKKEPLE